MSRALRSMLAVGNCRRHGPVPVRLFTSAVRQPAQHVTGSASAFSYRRRRGLRTSPPRTAPSTPARSTTSDATQDTPSRVETGKLTRHLRR